MNKKIKIIDLLNKIANGEEAPNIIFRKDIYRWVKTSLGEGYKNHEEQWLEDNIFISKEDLNQEVEILEDNTEEIEELTAGDLANIDGMANSRIMNKFNKLVKAVNEIRKEKNNV